MKNHILKNKDTRISNQASPIVENKNTCSHSEQESCEDVSRVKELHSQLKALGKTTFSLAREAGEILFRLKKETPHGKWESYVEKDLGIRPRTASNYMNIWRNTSSYENIGEFLQSEIVSDMGIREVLDYFAEQKKLSTIKSDDSTSSRQKATPKSQPDEALSLADDSKISFKKINWKEGLISKDCLENSFSKLTSKTETPADEKCIARKQRFVAEIAASINRCSGKATPEAAMEIAQAALKIVSKMVSESDKYSQHR